MPRHAAAESPTRIAGWIWAALIALVVVIALAVAWIVLVGRDDGDDGTASDGTSCVDGDQELLVWADPAAEDSARRLVDTYNDSGAVVRDRCVTATLEITGTAEAAVAYREGQPGVAPVWIPAGGGFVPGLSGAPAELPVVGTDELVHVVPEGADPAPGAAEVPPGVGSMVSAMAADLILPGNDPTMDAAVDRGADGDVTAQDALQDGLPLLTSANIAGDAAGEQIASVVFPLVAFGSSPAVDEDGARAAADFAGVAAAESPDEPITPRPAPPRLAMYAGTLAGVGLEAAER
ncbi:MAG: hypothetical protein ACTH1D_09540 [Mycobacteriaceae bacterium]